MRRVSVDIGGTFTDCFLTWDGRHIATKALTTHQNLSVGFMESLARASKELDLDVKAVLSSVDSVRYGTTLGTNALIARTGPQVGLLVTAGFESTVPLSRGNGYGAGLPPRMQADLPAAARPEPIVPIELIGGIRERMDAVGRIVVPLDEEGMRREARKLVDRGAQAFVVMFVNSVVNPEHERRAEAILLDEYASHNLGAIPIVLSHLVTRRKGEYVRATSAILDGYMHQEMYHGLSSLELALRERGYDKPMLVMHNTGGMAQLNSTHALQTIHSGPVAGVAASEHLSEQFDLGNVIATDMGGTSFDIGLVVGGGIKMYDFNPIIDRWLVSVPMIHLNTLGAGGGSIARYDRMFNAVEVGPRSAGSDPGPACYDRGGTKPTVTDADLVLGYLDPTYYAGGRIKLNPKRSERAIMDEIADELGVDVVEAALQIKRKVDANMAIATLHELGIRGFSPKDFTLLCYGGCGPLHMCGIAEHLGIDRVLVPPFSSVFCALGAGNMGQLHIHERSVIINLYDSNQRSLFKDFDELNAMVAELEALGREDLLRQGVPPEAVLFRLELDMRYGNQLVETSVVAPAMRIGTTREVLELVDAFNESYSKRFGKGSEAPEAGVRISTVRVATHVAPARIMLRDSTKDVPLRPAPKSASERSCRFSGDKKARPVPVYRSESLEAGMVLEGPAIVEAPTTTFLVEPGWTLTWGLDGSAVFRRHRRA